MRRFVAIDVETANADMASICQIGLAAFEDGEEVDHFVSLIDPEDSFDEYNVQIHGINEALVAGQPTFGEIYGQLEHWLTEAIVVCHTHFDRVSLRQAYEFRRLPEIACRWLDSAKMARRTWPEVAYAGYGLANISQMLGFTFRHHDALEDARAAGRILLTAMSETGLDLHGCLDRCSQRLSERERIKLDAKDGPLSAERIVFTGSLSITRSEAAALANGFGAAIDPGVTKKTSLLVVGDQDILKLNGAMKSSKHRKAEELIAKGQNIRIIRESDFATLCDQSYL